MARGKTSTVVFKRNLQGQTMLLPPDLGELIPADHPVRVVNDILERIDITELLRQYRPGGTSSYHPRMLLKVLVYSYINNLYSSRRIEESVGQNIHYMWLAGMSRPDHNTINRFRGKRLQGCLRPIFTQVVLLLCEEGLLSIKELYTDGTKIEANAGRYTFVWGNAIKHSKERIKKQLNELWEYAKGVAASELDDPEPPGNGPIDSEKVKDTIARINDALKGSGARVDKKVKQKLNYAKNRWPGALERYAGQEEVLGKSRKSYSKTDTDATFMRMKEDHMRNGQLKPAYNVQISTNNQYIASYSIHQRATDTTTLIPHLEQHISDYGKPANITADAGYGSEENYRWLERKRITGYVKHNYFDRDQNGNIRSKKPYTVDKLAYDPERDLYYCPSGEPMDNIGTRRPRTGTGFGQTITLYRARSCEGCPLRPRCHQQQGNRIIQVNHNLNRLKRQAEKRLKSKRGIKKRKQRCHDVEPVFGNIKHNHGFKRFMLRGLDKVNVEMGLLALAHNLRKRAS